MREYLDVFPLLGLPVSDGRVIALLRQFDIDPSIRFAKGETSEVVENHAHGVEVTFRDESVVPSARGKFLEGEPILVNFRMYTRKTDEFQPFQGELPAGLRPGMKRIDVEKLLGRPSFSNEKLGTARWDRPEGSIAISIAPADETLRYVSVLLWP